MDGCDTAAVAGGDGQAVMARRPRSGAGWLEGEKCGQRVRQMVGARAIGLVAKINWAGNEIGPGLDRDVAHAMAMSRKALIAIDRRQGLLDGDGDRRCEAERLVLAKA